MRAKSNSKALGIESGPLRVERPGLGAMDGWPLNRRLPRRLGQYGDGGGPTVLCIAGLHGNEPAGVSAVLRVLEALRRHKPVLHGQFVAFAGNLEALREGRRFLATDLNREWHTQRVSRLRARYRAGEALADERREMVELVDALEPWLRDTSRGVYVLDLHTTSATSPPFVTLGDTLRNRSFARRLPLPIILGIEEQIDAPMLEYINERGAVTLSVEAGQHRSDESVDRHEWALWTVLLELGCLSPGAVPEAARAAARLRQPARSLPGVFEVRQRHEVKPGDDFTMRPGFRNFQRVRAGEAVADDASGSIEAPEDGLLFLPRYQAMGDDGFFIVRPVRTVWLHVSWLLRKLRLASVIHWLPGVRRLAGRRNTLIVTKTTARWWATKVFHLLGYRCARRAGDHMLCARRAHDLRAPDEFDPL